MSSSDRGAGAGRPVTRLLGVPGELEQSCPSSGSLRFSFTSERPGCERCGRSAAEVPGVRLKGKLLTKGLCPRVAVETLETVAVVPEPSSEFACAP